MPVAKRMLSTVTLLGSAANESTALLGTAPESDFTAVLD
jgi:hypothetical protein